MVKKIIYEKNECVSGSGGGVSSNGPALECATFAAFIMGLLPAHQMRSLGGAFDNESIAMTAMTATFYFWIRSLRACDKTSPIYGFATGIAYFYMAASWG